MTTRQTLLRCLGISAALALSSCTLYFGDDGYYDDSWSDDYSDGGWYCGSDFDCASGCYCDDAGYCQEAGYCTTDADCADGYQCDEARNSCDPDGTSGCTDNSECASGCYCDPESESSWEGCVESCYCTTDAEAQNQGWGFCDEERTTCMPGTDPDAGSCGGDITCAFGAPTCPPNEVPLIKDGCWTGECAAVLDCDVNPTCEVLNTEFSCLDRSDCFPVYTGTNCTNEGGTACQAGDSGCTCENYEFDECRTSAN